MVDIVCDRMTSRIDGEFVVFLVGMRINRPWKLHKWLPVFLAMPTMLRELHANPELGFLGQESWFGRTTIMVQYWRSFEQLENYARGKTSAHLPAWARFNRQVGSNGDVGIWHETYLSGSGRYECIYNNMPRFGLGKAYGLVPAAGERSTADGRVRAGS